MEYKPGDEILVRMNVVGVINESYLGKGCRYIAIKGDDPDTELWLNESDIVDPDQEEIDYYHTDEEIVQMAKPLLIDFDRYFQILEGIDTLVRPKKDNDGYKYDVGDYLYVQEPFYKDNNGAYYYYYDYTYKLRSKDVFDWEPSYRMPVEAARIFLWITEIKEANTIHELIDDGLKAELIRFRRTEVVL